jgi:membrane-associated phospholipid phosphatase
MINPGETQRSEPGHGAWRYLDAVSLWYLGFVALLLIWRREHANSWWWAWVCLHGFLAVGILFLSRRPRMGFVGWLADLYPLPLFLVLYRESEVLNHAFFATPLDANFLAFEGRWFGIQPSLAFAERLPSTLVAEVLYGAYFSFYPMIIGMGVWLLVHDRKSAQRFLGNLAAVFYTCYGLFIVFPVVGPRILDLGGLPPDILARLGLADVSPMPLATQLGPFARLMSLIYDWFEGAGGAFPSSHVVVACLVLRESFRHRLKLRWIQSIVVLLLCLGTVYGRYHYASDVVAGLLIFWPLTRLSEYLQDRYDRRRALLQAGAQRTRS